MIWLISKHFAEKEKVRLDATWVDIHKEGSEIVEKQIWFYLVNSGQRNIIVTSISVEMERGTLSQNSPIVELPVQLAPGEYRTLKSRDMTESFGSLKNIYANDSLGRRYPISRKNRREMIGRNQPPACG